MKTNLLVTFFALALSFANSQSNADTLTNEKVIKLSKLGLQASVIINKIQTGMNQFDVSTDAIIKLSENGVAADVINIMMKTNTQAQNAVANKKDMKDPLTKRATGIYYYNLEDKENPLRRVDPTVTTVSSSGGFGTLLAQAYTGGIAQSEDRSTLSGPISHLQLNEISPTFYFYFDNDKNPNSDSWFFATATSPNEFVLVKLKEKKDSRQLAVGTSNAYGGSSGIPNKVKFQFDYKEISDGIYKVTFTEPLKKGQYCFLYASATPTRYSNNKVFDFGIVVDKK